MQEEQAAAADELHSAVKELQQAQSELDRCKQDLAVAQVAAEERLQQDQLKEQQDVQVSALCSSLYPRFPMSSE